MQSNNERLNLLSDEIRELNYFIRTLDVKQIVRGDGSKDNKCIIKTSTKKSISIFGSRTFGIGEHKSEINVPDEIIPFIVDHAKKQLDKIKAEYDSLFQLRNH